MGATAERERGSLCGLVSLSELQSRYQVEPEPYVVGDLIPQACVSIAAGDSGLGKSPWAYQLGLCVSSGIEFLGHSVARGTVVYVDFENGASGIRELTASLIRYLGIPKAPGNFLVHQGEGLNLEAIIRECRPTLVIVDSLRAYHPEAEEKNGNAASLMKMFRRMARKYTTSFLVIHHIRKPGETGAPSLHRSSAREWLWQASGARALINQTDVRLAFDTAAGVPRRPVRSEDRAAVQTQDRFVLTVKGFARLRGEFGPVYLARDFGEDGRPLGYRRLKGVELLFNKGQEVAFDQLPAEFTFKQARMAYNRGDQATADFLQKCIRVGILTHRDKTYLKVALPAE